MQTTIDIMIPPVLCDDKKRKIFMFCVKVFHAQRPEFLLPARKDSFLAFL